MTENEIKEYVTEIRHKADIFRNSGFATTGITNVFDKSADIIEELLPYMAIGTIEEFKALKEKNTPMELAEHNFQDEVHHYLCPSCRNIVSCNQNYCEECGQALEI